MIYLGVKLFFGKGYQNMKKPMNQSTLLYLLNFFTIGLVVLLVAFFITTTLLNDKILAKKDEQHTLNTYAQDFVNASDLLTDNVRAYAASQNTVYYDAYTKEVQVDKNRETSLAAIQEIGITDAEQQLLLEMSQLSNDLVPLEENAMKEVRMGHKDKAIQYVFGKDYSSTLVKIRELQNQFMLQLQTRTQNEVDHLETISYVLQIISLLFSVIVIISQICSIMVTRHRIIQPILTIQKEMMEFSKGNLSTHSDLKADSTELGMLVAAIQSSRETLRSYITDISQKLTEMVKGNMNQRVDLEYIGDFADIKVSLQTILTSLSSTLRNIDLSAEQVNSQSSQIASGAQALAQGATEQAASVEELAATINDVSKQINHTAERVEAAMAEINQSNQEVLLCNDKMREMTDSMGEIRNASFEIGKIIKTIEDIAFQTNILALNAAVEAARAGAAGKGFSVVASEVRNLASKSAEASKQTAQLIENATNAVNKGVSITTDTANVLSNVVESIQKSDHLMEQIAIDASEETEAMSQIDIGISQISSVVQTNSATAEESAAASTEMGRQAALLKNMVDQFILLDEDAIYNQNI